MRKKIATIISLLVICGFYSSLAHGNSDTLSRVVSALQVLVGMEGNVTDADIYINGKVDMADAIFGLQIAAGLRSVPQMATVSPLSGVVGASVTITGSNFGSLQGSSNVKFNGTSATAITNWSDTSIVCAVPAGATTGNVVVTVNHAASDGAAFTVTVMPPQITGINPSGCSTYSTVAIMGSYFGDTQGASTVKFGANTVTVHRWSDMEIVCTAPSSGGNYSVVVNVGGNVSNSVNQLVTTLDPQLSSLSVTAGVMGTSVTINGYYFGETQGTSMVTFANAKATTITSWSDTRIICQVPEGATTGEVTVTRNGRKSSRYFSVTDAAPASWAWSDPTPTGSSLYKVWGSSANDIFMVGQMGSIYHSDGAGWSRMNSGTALTLMGVWGTAPNDVFAVGDGGVILHYDGSAWSQMTSGTTKDLSAVYGTASNNVYAVGYGSTVLRYDGSQWTPIAAETIGVYADFYSLWAMGDNVFIGGSGGKIARYNGTAWVAMTSGSVNHIFGIWGTTVNNVYAVTSDKVIRYDGNAGSTWSTFAQFPSAPLGIWGLDANNIYVVSDSPAKMHYYNGATWTPNNTGINWNLTGVWGSAVNNVYAVGSQGLIFRYNGAAWSRVDSRATSLESIFINGISGTASNNIYAVADRGTIYHHDGTGWSSAASGRFEDLYGTWGTATNNFYAVGTGGIILRYDGAGWLPEDAGAYTLYDIWGSSGNDIFAVGSLGTIRHYNGTGWSSMISGVPASITLFGVWGTAANNVYAVGSDGAILHYNGSIWRTMASGIPYTLYDVWGSSGNDIFAVGGDGADGNGTILHYDGSVWREMTVGVKETINGVWGTALNNVYAVTYDGRVLHYDGTSWRLTTPIRDERLDKIWGSGADNIFAVGSRNIIKYSP